MIDYAHNPAGLNALLRFIKKLPHKHHTVILNGTGDRRDDDLREMGKLCGENFERIVIRRGDYLRGRDEQNMYELLQEGIRQSGRDIPVEIVPDSREAIQHALKNAQAGELVVTLGDRVRDDIEFVKEFRDSVTPIES